MTHYKILFVAGAALFLGGCSLNIDALLKGELGGSRPSPTPNLGTQPDATPNTNGGTMESNSYSLQGTGSLSEGDDDASLQEDLNEVNVNSNLEMMVQ